MESLTLEILLLEASIRALTLRGLGLRGEHKRQILVRLPEGLAEEDTPVVLHHWTPILVQHVFVRKLAKRVVLNHLVGCFVKGPVVASLLWIDVPVLGRAFRVVVVEDHRDWAFEAELVVRGDAGTEFVNEVPVEGIWHAVVAQIDLLVLCAHSARRVLVQHAMHPSLSFDIRVGVPRYAVERLLGLQKL